MGIEKIIRIENTASIEKVDVRYHPIIDEVIREVPSIIEDSLSEIRLLGSVPRGNAIPHISDIDFLIITENGLPDDQRNRILGLSEDLQKDYPFVWSVDLTVLDKESLSKAPDQELIISTDSISLYGKDNYSRQYVDILNTELNELWGLVPSHFESRYRKALLGADSEQELKQLSKWIGKDMLKCFRRKVISDYGILDRQIEPLYKRLRERYPDYRNVFERLWSLYSSPVSDSVQIERVFNDSIGMYKELVWEESI